MGQSTVAILYIKKYIYNRQKSDEFGHIAPVFFGMVQCRLRYSSFESVLLVLLVVAVLKHFTIARISVALIGLSIFYRLSKDSACYEEILIEICDRRFSDVSK